MTSAEGARGPLRAFSEGRFPGIGRDCKVRQLVAFDEPPTTDEAATIKRLYAGLSLDGAVRIPRAVRSGQSARRGSRWKYRLPGVGPRVLSAAGAPGTLKRRRRGLHRCLRRQRRHWLLTEAVAAQLIGEREVSGRKE